MKRRILKALVAIVAVGGLIAPARSQEEHGTSISRVVRLNRAPVNKEILRVRLPRPKETMLANGLAVLVLERHDLPTVAFALWIKTGALADPKDLPGLASFTAQMLREGTTHRTSAQLALNVDEIGASLSASADFGSDISTVTASGLVENAERILELMSDMVLNPAFPSDELDKFKQRELAALEQELSSPDFLSRQKFYQVLYRSFPAAAVTATPDSVNGVTADQLKAFHDHYYTPNNAVLGVVGDVEFDRMVPLVEKHFGAWKNHSVHPPDLAALPPPAPRRVLLVDRPNSVQTNIVAGDFAVRRADPEYIPLTVMNRVLGGGPSARLFLDLREEHGYTYDARSYFSADVYPGPWIAATQVRNQVTDGALHELMAQFKKIREDKVPEAELEDAQRSIVARFALSLEQPSSLLNGWMTVKYYSLPEDYWDRYPEEVAKVTPDVVERMAGKYVDLDHLQIVCVGDGKQIKDVLKKYGPLEVYDTNGKRME